jgi:hypothetical protein
LIGPEYDLDDWGLESEKRKRPSFADKMKLSGGRVGPEAELPSEPTIASTNRGYRFCIASAHASFSVKGFEERW